MKEPNSATTEISRRALAGLMLAGGGCLSGLVRAQTASAPAIHDVANLGGYLNPATTDQIEWYTDSSVTDTSLELGPFPGVRTKPRFSNPIPGKGQTYHETLLENLKPGTVYTFRIHAGDQVGPEQTFTTATIAEGYPPSPLPDRIILTICTDPATSMAVTWRTDTTIHAPMAEIIEADPTNSLSPRFRNESLPVPAVRQVKPASTSLTGGNVALYHSASFTGLKPATQYAYRVGGDGKWSEWLQFTTAGSTTGPFSFLYLGDAQNDIKAMWPRVVREAFREQPGVRFVVHAGDLVGYGDSERYWGEWFASGAWFNGMIPSIPVTGNHEYISVKGDPPYNAYGWDDKTKSVYTGRLTENWRHQFTFPDNGPDGLKESVYYVDYQGVRIVVLNSTEICYNEPSRARQKAWLEKVLASNPCQWTLVAVHHPTAGTEPWVKDAAGQDVAQRVLQTEFKPLFEKYRVDLVMHGHNHQYQRGQSRSFQGQPEIAGPVYIVSVSGPKMYDPADKIMPDMHMDRVARDLQLFQVVTIDGDTLKLETYDALGRLYDAFDIVKQGIDQPNKIVNRIPKDVPEHRRPSETGAAT